MKSILILFLAITMLTACERKKENIEETEPTALTVFQGAMKIHDEVMPRMDEMYKLERKLKTLKDSLLADSVANAQKINVVREKLSALKDANKGMMDWMHNVQDVPGAPVSTSHEHHSSEHADTITSKRSAPDELLKIQQDQKKRIEEVKVAMEKSIEDAKKLLAN